MSQDKAYIEYMLWSLFKKAAATTTSFAFIGQPIEQMHYVWTLFAKLVKCARMPTGFPFKQEKTRAPPEKRCFRVV